MPCFDCIYLDCEKKSYSPNKIWVKFGCKIHGYIGSQVQLKPISRGECLPSVDNQLKTKGCGNFKNSAPEQLKLL